VFQKITPELIPEPQNTSSTEKARVQVRFPDGQRLVVTLLKTEKMKRLFGHIKATHSQKAEQPFDVFYVYLAYVVKRIDAVKVRFECPRSWCGRSFISAGLYLIKINYSHCKKEEVTFYFFLCTGIIAGQTTLASHTWHTKDR
jgi:hypothetical protein